MKYLSICASQIVTVRNHLGETSIDDQIENSAEDLVSHKNGEVEVGDGHGTSIFGSVWPVSRSSKTQTDHVQGERNCEQFSDKCLD